MYNSYLIQKETTEESCIFCKYYKQHYVKCRTQYIPCFAGHCMKRRMKGIKPDFTCDDFMKEEQDGITNN